MLFYDEPRRKKPGKGIKEALVAKQKGRCMYCGHAPGPEYMHVDHKTPVARSGSNSLANYQLLCGPCNTLKGTKMAESFGACSSWDPLAAPPRRRNASLVLTSVISARR